MVVNGFGAVCTAVVDAGLRRHQVPRRRLGRPDPDHPGPGGHASSRIHRHYRELATQLSLDDYGAPPRIARHRVILPISGVHRGTLAALRYARALSDDVTAVHVSIDPEEAERGAAEVGACGATACGW